MGNRTLQGLAALAIVLGSALPAQAFYWRGWPASVRVADHTLITPTDNDTPDTPVLNYPPPVYVTIPPPGGPPIQTPEPATGLIALVGLGTMAAVRKCRKK
jgi:hypothetical protein